MHENYADICGYTQKDVETTFKPYLKGVDMLIFGLSKMFGVEVKDGK